MKVRTDPLQLSTKVKAPDDKPSMIVAHDPDTDHVAFNRAWQSEFEKTSKTVRQQFAPRFANAGRLRKLWLWCSQELQIRVRVSRALIRRLY
jgi:hypothetical protein